MRLLLLLFIVLSQHVYAAGVSGLTYETYAAGGASPSRVNRTLLTSGVLSSINYNWGGGYVLDSGRADGVIVHLTGYYKVDTTGTYTFGMNSDDGTILTINGTTLVNYWGEQGSTLRYGSVYLTAGTVVPVEIWYYENGGGAVLQFYQYSGGWFIVPTASLATDSTYWQPTLCCGGSSTAFGVNATNVSKFNSFTSRTTADTKIDIEQVGNFNTTIIEQTGTKNNYTKYYVNGSSNSTSIKQDGGNNTQTNYVDLSITGNSNVVDIKQRTSGETTAFIKGTFANISGNNNNLTVDQKNSGSHYAEVNLSGGNKTVSIIQTGVAGHMASITLTGYQQSLDLQQTGASQQFYSIVTNCASAGGCAPITVRQGN